MQYENWRQSRPRWALPGIWLALCGMLLCTVWLGQLKREIPDANSESPKWSEVVIVVPIAAAFLAVIIFAAARFDRRSFRITERGIGSDRRFFLFKQIAGAEWVDAGRFHVLKLSFSKLPARLYGVPDLQTRSKVELLLRERGIESQQLSQAVESLSGGDGATVYKFMIGVFVAMTIWCAGLGLLLMFMVNDLKFLKANADDLTAKYNLVSQQLKAAGLARENLKNTGRAENALWKEAFQRLMRMQLISVGLWSGLCCVIGFFLMRSVTEKKKDSGLYVKAGQ